MWRTHTRTLIIVSHALAHRTSFFDDRTRTRTRTFFYDYTVAALKSALFLQRSQYIDLDFYVLKKSLKGH